MRRQKLWALVLLCCAPFTQAACLPGAGTEASPFLVASYADLAKVGSTTVCGLGKVYRLTTDIDASDTGEGFPPIGPDQYNVFTGSLHGGGHAIHNLTIQRPTTGNIGLFGYLSGTLDSLDLIDASILGGGPVGGLVARSDGKIVDCSVSGSITNTSSISGYTGEIVGENNLGTITRCSMKGTVTGVSRVGGIAGFNYTKIEDCSVTGTVVGSGSTIGGIAGENYGSIARCLVNASVLGQSSTSSYDVGDVGGIVGWNALTVRECYSTGSVSGMEDVGGIAGFSMDTLIDCFSLAHVSGTSKAGGIVGNTNSGGNILRTYAAGLVSGTVAGGIVGTEYGETVKWCYWNLGTTNQSSGFGFTGSSASYWISDSGLTTAQMMDSASFVGFSFSPDSAWSIDQGKAYPILRHLPAPPDSTTAVRKTSSSRSTGVSLRREGSDLVLALPQAAWVRIVDAQGRDVLPRTSCPAGENRIPLPSSQGAIFLVVRGSGISRAVPVGIVR